MVIWRFSKVLMWNSDGFLPSLVEFLFPTPIYPASDFVAFVSEVGLSILDVNRILLIVFVQLPAIYLASF